MTTARATSGLPIGAVAAPAGEALPVSAGDSLGFAAVMAEALTDPAAGNQSALIVMLASPAPMTDQLSSQSGELGLENAEPLAPERGIPPAHPAGALAPEQSNPSPYLRFATVTQSTQPEPRSPRPVVPAAVADEPPPATPVRATLDRPTRAPEMARQRPSEDTPPLRSEGAKPLRPAEANAAHPPDDSVTTVQIGPATFSLPVPVEPLPPPTTNPPTEPRQENPLEIRPAMPPPEIAATVLPLPNGIGPTTVPSARISTEARPPVVKPATPSSTALPLSERQLASAQSRAVDEPQVSSSPLPATGTLPAELIPKQTPPVVRPEDREVAQHNADRLLSAPWNAGGSPPRLVHSAAELRHATPGHNDALALVLETPPLLAGTRTAEQGIGMKQDTEPKQFAGLALPNLPELGVASQSMAPELVRRGERRSLLTAVASDARSDGAAQLFSLWSPNQPGDRATVELIAQPAGVASGLSLSTEALQSSVLKHVTELRLAGAIEMAVVLKPDAETELALRLTMDSKGEVTVQARCEQGDAPTLAAHWGEIRHSLAQQGVRLGALEFSPGPSHDTFHPHAGNGGPSPDGQPSPQRHGQPWTGTLDDLPLTGSLTEPPGRRGVQRPPAGRTRLLESWA